MKCEVPTRPLLLAGPTVEPVSLAGAKAWLKIDGADEDELVGALVTSARLVVESATRRMLISQSWRLVRDAWPGDNVVDLPLAPLRQIDAIRVIDAAGVARALAPETYRTDANADAARLIFVEAPPAPGRAAGIEIDVTVGYGDSPANVPAPLRQAILALVARWFENRGDALSPPTADPLPSPAAELIAPFRRWRLA